VRVVSPEAEDTFGRQALDFSMQQMMVLPAMIRRNPVYFIDDDESMRDAVLLNLRVSGLTAIGFADCKSFLSTLPSLNPGCILLDLQMPTKGGLELQAELIERCVRWPIIVITGTGTLESCRTAFRCGAVDFLCKPVGSNELLSALKPAFARLDALLECDEASLLLHQLSPREREVFDLLWRGLSTKEIAKALCISTRTIDAHRANISSKLGTRSVAEFVQIQMRAVL
jgi:FixJ family two-component response regulator